VIAGASDSAVNPFVYMAFEQAGVTDVPAEGAGAFVLERRDHALARGAHVYAEVLAYTSTGSGREACDRAVAAVCADGAVTPEQIRWTVGDVRRDDVPHIGFTDQLGHALAASVPITLALALADPSSAHEQTDALVAVCGTTGPSVAMALRLPPHREQ
jgi:3-oxoacyl-(acyl-carrier-protein) synthase